MTKAAIRVLKRKKAEVAKLKDEPRMLLRRKNQILTA